MRTFLLISAFAFACANPCNAADAVQPAAGGEAKAPFAYREFLGLAHFGNTYEVWGDDQMRDVFKEAKFWGFNGYGDYYNNFDIADPFAPEPGHQRGHGDVYLDIKRAHYRLAQDAGLDCALLVTPNSVYVTQYRKEVAATRTSVKSKRLPSYVNGPAICPSIPEARATILRNYDNFFKALAGSGVRLKSFYGQAYDFGGCRCAKCDPWILTFAKLMREIHLIADKYHPGITMNMEGWWWSPQEHRLFADWVDKNAPGWINTMFINIHYGVTQMPKVALPKGCKPGALVHIGYSDTVAGTSRDIYAHLGPVIAANRIEATLKMLKANGVASVTFYSEGVYTDVNNAVAAGLSSGQYQTTDEVLEAYARRHFDVDATAAKGWAAWLRPWSDSFHVDTDKSAGQLKQLLAKTPKDPRDCWRLQQWVLKQELFAANKEVGSGDKWTPPRLAAADRFWSVQEKLQRGVWGMGPQTHIFGRASTPLPWYKSWAGYKSIRTSAMEKNQ